VLYTAPQRVILSSFVFTNPSDSAITVAVSLVAAGGSLSTSNALVNDLAIQGNDIYQLANLNIPLEQGDSIQCTAATDATVNITGVINDREESTR
jgi:hypothetical protein